MFDCSYKYSWEHERYWRKTRTPQDNGCIGVDANRNWPYKWGGAIG